MVLGLMFKSLIHFKLVFVSGVRVSFHYFACDFLVFLVPFVEKTILYPLSVLRMLIDCRCGASLFFVIFEIVFRCTNTQHLVYPFSLYCFQFGVFINNMAVNTYILCVFSFFYVGFHFSWLYIELYGNSLFNLLKN